MRRLQPLRGIVHHLTRTQTLESRGELISRTWQGSIYTVWRARKSLKSFVALILPALKYKGILLRLCHREKTTGRIKTRETRERERERERVERQTKGKRENNCSWFPREFSLAKGQKETSGWKKQIRARLARAARDKFYVQIAWKMERAYKWCYSGSRKCSNTPRNDLCIYYRKHFKILLAL